MNELLLAINKTPIIDHHAHNLLLDHELMAREFLAITTEAEGPALAHSKSSLSHLRAVKQLSTVLGCESTWEAVKQAVEVRREESSEEWAKQCFAGIFTVLIDDGLDQNTVHPWDWHNRLVPSACKRIVRIEVVAEKIILGLIGSSRRSLSVEDATKLTEKWFKDFRNAIIQACYDPNVVGFKSVICYRTGLNIVKKSTVSAEVLNRYLTSPRFPRIQDEELNPLIVHTVMMILSHMDVEHAKPIQFHTGLGDNDIILTLANPSHMQPFIEQYPTVKIVLLHASYPFTREAGYLAAVYANCYLDIGEVFPFVSQDGQERVIRESLELCPSEKLLWSTDGHWFPETYLLAVVQMKEGLTNVLGGYVQKHHLTTVQAIHIVQDLLFNTANQLYNLSLDLVAATANTSSLQSNEAPVILYDSERIPQIEAKLTPTRGAVENTLPGYSLFTEFASVHPEIKFLRMTWLDYTSILRLRIIPLETAISLFSSNRTLSVTAAVLGLLQNDVPAPSFGSVGEYDLVPDFSSLRLCERESWATVACEFKDVEAGNPGLRQDLDICPRTVLRKQVERGSSQGVEFLIGFEIEVVFLDVQSVSGSQNASSAASAIISPAHAWSVAASIHSPKMQQLLEDIVADLNQTGVQLMHFHPESAPGQFEFVLPPASPLVAVDTMLAAKETIASAAMRYGLRATCVPKPFPTSGGSGAHFHSSMTPESLYPSFYAGIMKQLKGIATFSLPSEASYERMVDGCWAGGRWVTWGTMNKEVPLRKINGSHWEFKWCDGMANSYLVVAAFLGAGLEGVNEGLEMNMKDCLVDPASMSWIEKDELGIQQNLWRDFEEGLDALEKDGDMSRIMGEKVVKAFVGVKRAEMKLLGGMSVDERREFLISRY